MVRRLRGRVVSGLLSVVFGSFGVVSLTRVRHISNISRVSITNGVFDSLDTAIGQSNGVRSAGGISVMVFLGIVLGAV